MTTTMIMMMIWVNISAKLWAGWQRGSNFLFATDARSPIQWITGYRSSELNRPERDADPNVVTRLRTHTVCSQSTLLCCGVARRYELETLGLNNNSNNNNKKRNTYKIYIVKPGGQRALRIPDVDGGITLTHILKKLDGRMEIGFNWITTKVSGGLLLTRQWTFWYHRKYSEWFGKIVNC